MKARAKALAELLKESVYVRQVGTTLATSVSKLFIALGTTAMIARWLGPGGKGTLSVLLLAPYMLQLCLNLGIGTANTYFAGSKKLSVAQLTSNSVAFALLGSAAGGVITLALLASGKLGAWLPGVTTPWLLLSLVAFPLNLFMLYLHSIYIGLRRMSTLNLIQLAQALLILPCMPIFVAWLKLGVPGALLAYIVPQALLLIPTVWYLKTKGATFTPRLDRAVVGPVLHYGVRGFVANLLDFFNYRLDSFLVNYFVGPVGAGIYSASVALAELLWQLPIAAGLVHFAKASGSDRGTLNKFTPKVFWIVFGFSLAGALGLAAVGKIAIRVIYSAAFMDAYKPLLLLLPGVVLVGSARILNNDINGRGHPIYNSITAAVALVVTIALDLILIPRMGVPGAAIASTAAYAVMFVLSVVFYLTVSRGKAPADAPRVAAGVPDA